MLIQDFAFSKVSNNGRLGVFTQTQIQSALTIDCSCIVGSGPVIAVQSHGGQLHCVQTGRVTSKSKLSSASNQER